MARAITREEYDLVKPMVRGSYLFWYLLELPNGQWGALWDQGLGSENACLILQGDLRGLAFVGTQAEVQAYIHNSLVEIRQDKNNGIDFEIKSANQMFRNVKPGRKARAPRWEDI